MTPDPPHLFCRDEQLLTRSMTSIIINILHESEEAFQQLLGVVLQNLVKQKGVRFFLILLILVNMCFLFFSWK